MAKRIILSADDFGRNPYRNKAIDEAFSLGLIKSAALIVNSPSTLEAIDMAERGGYLSHIHCHFNFVGGKYNDYLALSEEMRQCTEMTNGQKFNVKRSFPYCRLRLIRSIRLKKAFLAEMVAQYELFVKLTKGKANYNHVDFHWWYNLNWPVALALRDFTKMFKIKSVRYWGERFNGDFCKQLLYKISKRGNVKDYNSSAVDFYLRNLAIFKEISLMEVYVHPDLYTGSLMDNTSTKYKLPKKPLQKQISDLLETNQDIEFVSWEEI